MQERHPVPQQLMLVCPILPGRVEAWRRLVQEMTEERGGVYAESRAHLNIYGEQLWIHETVDAAVAILVIETDQPNRLLHLMKTSEWPFDGWFRPPLWVHLGVEAGTPIDKYLPELVFEWQAA